MKLIYIAGPLFTEEQRRYLEKVEKAIQEIGYKTYLPHRDAGIFKRNENSGEEFFKKDIEKINECNIVVAVLNGSEVDSGTSWEMGFAYSKNIKIYGILDDTRKPSKNLLNPMILNSTTEVVDNIEELKKILIKNE